MFRRPSTSRAYRSAVGEVVDRFGRGIHAADDAGRVLARVIAAAGLDLLTGSATGGSTALWDRLVDEVRAFRPSVRSNAHDLPTFVWILLLHQVDVGWWAGVPPFADAVAASSELVSLTELQREGDLGFRFRLPPAGLPGRARH